MSNQNAVLAVLEEKDFIDLLLIVPALSLKYKRVVVYTKDLPTEFEEFLKTKYNVKVINEQDCINYDYALVVKDITIDQVKLEYKNNSVYLYIAKPDLTIDDVNLLKLRKVDRYSLNKAVSGCNVIKSDYWIKYAGQLNETWAKLFLSIKTGSILGLKKFIKSNTNLDSLWEKINYEANRGYISIGDIQDFLNGLMLVALYNVLHDTEIAVVLTGAEMYGCIPSFSNTTFSCIRMDVDEILQTVQEQKKNVNNNVNTNQALNTQLNTQQLSEDFKGLSAKLAEHLNQDESNLEVTSEKTDQQETQPVVNVQPNHADNINSQQSTGQQATAIQGKQGAETPETQSSPSAELKELTKDVEANKPRQAIIEQNGAEASLNQTTEEKGQLGNSESSEEIKETINSVDGKDPEITKEESRPKEGEPMPIDVEEWARRIQNMLE